MPGRVTLQRRRPHVWKISERRPALPLKLPAEDYGRNPKGSLKTTPEVKARKPPSGGGPSGYRPSLLEEVKGSPDRLPVPVQDVLDWLAPEEPPGPLHGLSEILSPMTFGEEWSGVSTEADRDGGAAGFDALRPRGGKVRDLYLAGHGFQIEELQDESGNPAPRPRCCRICRAPITGRGYKFCSDGCRKVADSRRHYVFRPDTQLVDFVADHQDLPSLTISRMCGESQKKVSKILANLPGFLP
jgi:hypothetical protein